MKFLLFILISLLSITFVFSDPINCSICTSLINISETKLGKNATMESATNYLHNEACGVLPKIFFVQCNVVVTQNLTALATAVVNDANAQTTCTTLNQC